MDVFDWVYPLDEIAGEAYAEWVRSEFRARLSSASVLILAKPEFCTLFEFFLNKYVSYRYPADEDLVAWALSELEAGLDTPNLRILAGLTESADSWEVERYFNRTLDDLKIELPDGPPPDDMFRRQLMCQTARDIVLGAVSPREGCSKIYLLSVTQGGSGIEELDSWGLLDDGCLPKEMDPGVDWDSAIVLEAKALLASSFCAGGI